MVSNEFYAWDEELNKMYNGDEIEERDDLDAWLSYGTLAIYRIDEGEYTQLDPLKVIYKDTKHKSWLVEGDVLTSNRYPYQDEGKYNYHGVVEWDEEYGAFVLVKCCVDKDKAGISDGMADLLGELDLTEFEVLGNSFENPALLKSEGTINER
ncbi:hypothetical protein BN997_01087 [Oceanobacillus oncorhynchi]|uniref:YopX protein domain-containing protein n=1 Tax=Oceanobacillus oncorhynchi TaxID=545501 RepID=A0A0A1MNA3_9BACI|nr:YopX family protein [Oceanobacillus oncorhynchi]CEI81269.1 hypothetical protein BN997_01087 [Oceanobacillus oncorhynchi]